MSGSVRELLVGALVGAVLGLVGILLAPDSTPAAEVAFGTVVTTGVPNPARGSFWHDPLETLVGPAVVVPVSLVLEDGEVVLSYEVSGITTARRGIVFEERQGPPVGPEVFVLETETGEVFGQATRVWSSEVRFAVGDRFDLDSVRGARIDRFWVRVPHRSDFELPAVRGASVVLEDQVSVSVAAIVEQAGSVLINLDTTQRSELFIADVNPLVWVTGRGLGWRSSVRQSGAGIGGSTGVQLIFEGTALPDPLPLSVTSPQWVPFDRSIPLNLTGVISG